MFSFPSIGLLSSALFLLVVDNNLVAGTIVAVDRGIGRRELRAARRASGRNARFVDMASCEDKCNGATTSCLESECVWEAHQRVNPASHPLRISAIANRQNGMSSQHDYHARCLHCRLSSECLG